MYYKISTSKDPKIHTEAIHKKKGARNRKLIKRSNPECGYAIFLAKDKIIIDTIYLSTYN